MNAANSYKNTYPSMRILGSFAMTVTFAHLCLFSAANAETTLPKNTIEEVSHFPGNESATVGQT